LQVMLLFVFPFTVTFLLAFILMVETFGDETTGHYLKQGKFISNVLAKQSALSILYGSGKSAAEVGEAILEQPLIDQIAIFEKDGTLLHQQGQAHSWRKVLSVKEITTQVKEGRLECQNDNYWQFLTPVIISNSPDVLGGLGIKSAEQTIGYVRVLMSKSELHRVKRNFIINALIFSTLAALVFVLVVSKLTKQLTVPLRELSEAMSGFGEEKTKFEPPVHVAKEIGDIGRAYNEMMRALEERERELEYARDSAIGYAQAKSQFAANVSHEIRSPLNGILGTLNLLACMDPQEEQLEYIQLAQESGDQLIFLINDILDYSKMSAQQMPVESEDIDLQLILEDIISLQAGTPQAEGLELVCLFENNVPARVLGDAGRFRQLFNNLVSNAVKFTERGEVKVQAYLVSESEHSVDIQFSVTDSGIGISPDDQQGIFDPYSRKCVNNGGSYDGTGLGLAICKQIVELLAGKISVHSELGAGSEFCVGLTFKKVASQMPVFKGLADRIKLRVLIVAPPGSAALVLESFCKRHELIYQWTPNPYSLNDLLSVKSYSNAETDLDDVGETWVWMNWPQVTLDGLLNQLEDKKNTGQLRPCRFVSFQRQGLGAEMSLHNLFENCINKPIRRGALESLFDESMLSLTRARNQGHALSHDDDNNYQADSFKASSREALAYDGAKILVVEDNLINQKVALATLNTLGLHADVVNDGGLALKAIEKKRYALILMDCQMPVMNGYEATRRIRKLEASFNHTPIVAWTANVTPVERQRCIDCGMDDFLAKPFKRGQLVDILRRWLSEPAV